MLSNIKERFIGATGSVSGVASILGSWQVCHNICLGLIAILSVIGITVVGMPLLFLTKLAVPFWTAAFVLLLITLWFYVKKKCISSRLIMINSGLIIAGTPFQAVQRFSMVFWIIGGLLVMTGISLFIKDKIQKRKVKKMKTNTILLIIIGLLVTGMLTVAISGFVPGFSGKELNQEKNDKELPASEESFAMISSGSTGSGEVSVDLKPHKVSNGQLEVDISVNTHSVSLEKFNLKEITTLEFNGKSIRPVSAPSLTGHHNSGTLIFDVDKDMESFTIKILGIPKVEERIFEWRK